jgi:trimeric autotransporter adhesin
MLAKHARPQSAVQQRPIFWVHWMMALLVAVALALTTSAALAAPPAAGTSIGNQASASYTDGSGVTRTVTSNTVQTVVQQVASLTLTANGTKSASVGSTVYYPHTVTNTGNGSDTFTLGAVNAGGSIFNMTGITIYADNGSGLPTGPAITSSGPLAAGSTFKFIVAATVPGTATTGQTNSLTVTATSVFTPAQTANNTDTTTVTSNAVITVTKAVSVASGAAGTGPYTYTLTYTNTGNSTATAVKLMDTVPVGMSMVANSGLWSVTGATALTNATATYGTAPNQITYDFGVTTPGVVTAIISNVAAGQSGFVSFKVTVPAATVPGPINNTAPFSYNDGSGTTVNGSSGTVLFTVTQTANVAITGATVASANPGSSVTFTNVVQNTGNGTDTFNMSLSAGNFPVGTSFVLYKSDGLTPLIDTNGDSIADTGPLAAGASYNVVVKAVLPTNAAGAGPFTVNKTARSVVDNTKSAVAADTLTAITAATVDVTNNAPIAGVGVVGVGAGPEATAQVTKATNPGTSTTFVVVTNNTGPISDSYNLGASTVSTFASTTLPAGWTVVFKADGGGGNCATTGATITNTGTVNAGASSTVCAVVTVPTGFVAGTSDLYFRAQSPATGAQDTIHDAVTVNAVRALNLTPNNTGQVFPGGSTVYNHFLANNGNVVEGNGTVSTITFTAADSQAGWTSILYYDANGNGVLDATDPVIPAAGLQGVLAAGLTPGQSVTIFNKVTAPSGVAAGVVDTTTLTATTANGSYTSTVPTPAVATDSTTVISGNVTLVKTQSLNAGCSGPAGTYTTATITTGAIPGACIDYQITVQNVGAANATAVTVSDTTPVYTLLNTVPATTVGTITSTPAVGAAGSITATIGTLAPSQTAIVTFRVRITP